MSTTRGEREATSSTTSVARSPSRAVLALSLDFDGCLSLPTYLLPEFKKNPGLLLEKNQPLVEYIVALLQAHPQIIRLIVLVGSARQSHWLNKKNMEYNQNGSCFYFIPLFLQLLKEKIGKDFPHVLFEFDPILAADIYANTKPGENLQYALYERIAQQKRYCFAGTCSDKSKLLLTYIHLHYLLSSKLKESGTYDIRYEHVDDKVEILEGLLRFFSKYPYFMPKQITFHAHRFFKKTTIDLNGTHSTASFFQANHNGLAIQGTGDIDLTFPITVKKMVKRITTMGLPPADKPWAREVCQSLPPANAIELLPTLSPDDLQQLRHSPSTASAIIRPVIQFPSRYHQEELQTALTLSIIQRMLDRIQHVTIGTMHMQAMMAEANVSPAQHTTAGWSEFDAADNALGRRLQLREARAAQISNIQEKLVKAKESIEAACAKMREYYHASPPLNISDIDVQLDNIAITWESIENLHMDSEITDIESESKRDEEALAQWQIARKRLEIPAPSPTETSRKSTSPPSPVVSPLAFFPPSPPCPSSSACQSTSTIIASSLTVSPQ